MTRTLTNAIHLQRVPHAMLFTGARGVGKTSSARIIAMALNCVSGPTPSPCGSCDACTEIQRGSSVDVIEIDGASTRGIGEIRELRDGVRYAPQRDRNKIYIIDEVHMLTTEAFNALLKTLEEPPEHVKFVFATTDVQKVLPTILSRCQRFDLKPIPSELIVQRLQTIAVEEKINVSPEALACIARMADGGMRDAQSIFDQMISFCGSDIAEADVLDVYGLVSGEKINALAGAVAAGDHQKMQALVRNALLDAIAKGGRSERLGGVSMTTEQLTRLLDGLREGEGGVKLGLAEKINFEVTLLKAVEASRARAIDSLIKELAALAEESAIAESASDDSEKKKA